MRNATQYLIHQDLLHFSPRKPRESGYMRAKTVLLRFSPRKRRHNHSGLSKLAFSMIRWRRFSLHAQALPNGLQSSSKQQTSPRRDGTIKSSARKCRVGIANRSSPGRDGTEPPSSPSGSSSFDLGPQPDFLHQDRGRSSSYKINPTESSEISGQSENYWPDGITRLAHLRVRTER